MNSLRTIKPGANWKKSGREILLAQISAGKDLEPANWFEVTENLLPEKLVMFFSKPAAVVAAIALLVFGGGTASVWASAKAKPGDSLYIAKIISEKTQLAFTFDAKEKTKLNLEFAGKRVEEAARVIAEPDDEQDKNARIEELASSFKKEISAAKTRLSKNAPAPAAGESVTEGQEDGKVFGADFGRSNEGMEIAPGGEAAAGAGAQEGTSTPLATGPAARTPETALGEAEKLFDRKDYQGSLDMLKQASDIIDKGAPGPGLAAPVASGTEAQKGSATSTK